MQTLSIKNSFKLSTIFAFVLYCQNVLAQCTVNGEEVPCDQFWKDYGWIFAVAGIVFLFVIVFWFWMLVNCLRSSRKDKLVWTLVILFGNILGALLYFFIAKGKDGAA